MLVNTVGLSESEKVRKVLHAAVKSVTLQHAQKIQEQRKSQR